MIRRHIAVIDIGKTNAKLALVDARTLSEIAVVTRTNTVLPGPPWPHFDVEGHWAFILDGLTRFHASHRIDAISVTTHGACIALLGMDGALAAPVLDYEYRGPDDMAADYDTIRPPFSETGSPRLAAGLNVGAQLFWQLRTDPDLRTKIRHIVTYPQYWGFRLTGVPATDVTSLGCHTDLWNPFERRPSSLVDRLGIADLLAPTHRPGDVLGPILPNIAERTGLDPETPVLCGIHDSNASLLPHILDRHTPFSVVSTGTWVIAMAIGGDTVALDPTRDTLVNTNAFGDPVPSARFMGGREHDLLMKGTYAAPTHDDIDVVLRSGVMLLPAVVPDTGPYQGRTARWTKTEPPLASGERAACVGFYLALVTARCLELIGHRGPIHVEGPFAKNACYLDMLTTATGSNVSAMTSATGTSQGAALLARGNEIVPQRYENASPPARVSKQLAEYAHRWRACLDD